MIKRSLLAFAIWAGPAQADDTALLEFFAGQACAIGPSAKSHAIAAGLSENDIDRWSKSILINGNARMDGDWIVLSEDICTIAFPTINPPIRLDDPEVQTAMSDINAFAEGGDIGCFLDTQVLYEGLEGARGWDLDTTTTAYLQFVAAGLMRGDVRFYSESPLRTPPGFQILSRACGDVPNAETLSQSHRVFEENFDALVRMAGRETSCESGATPVLMDPAVLPNPNQTNAWSSFEMSFIAIGAGWFEGVSGTQKGRPRPPLCTFD